MMYESFKNINHRERKKMILAIKRLFAYWLDFLFLAICLVSLQWMIHFTTAGFPFKYFESG
jgi:hypothetical protein